MQRTSDLSSHCSQLLAIIATLGLASCAQVALDPEDEDAENAAIGTDGKADGSSLDGVGLAGAIRTANALTVDQLDNDVGLTTRAARNIVAARPLRTLAALDAVRYIGPVAITKLVAYADAQGWTAGDMARVPKGTFTMGNPNGLQFEPLHQVTLSTYWIDRFETTVGEWRECVAAGACRFPSSLTQYFGANYGDEHAVSAIDWSAANAYCQWRGKRLPSEAQWEKAARGADDVRVFPWGNDPITCDRTNVGVCLPPGSFVPAAVGSFPNGASPYGVEDMIGNVLEFVSDYYNEFAPTCAEPCIDPEGIPAAEAEQGRPHGLRGGFSSAFSRVGHPELHERTGQPWSLFLGFRCAAQ